MARKTAAKPPAVEHHNGESKTERFRRIGVPRVRRVLEGMGRLRHIANRSSYDYSPEEAAKVLEALRNGVNELEQAFKGPKVTTHFEL